MQRLCAGNWTKELVVGLVKHEEEIALFKEAGIAVLRLKEIIEEMVKVGGIVKAAAGADLLDLMLLGR